MFGDAEPAGVNVMTVQGKSTLTGSFTGDSTASLLNSAEADARILVRQADQTLSAPMARLRKDTVCFCAGYSSMGVRANAQYEVDALLTVSRITLRTCRRNCTPRWICRRACGGLSSAPCTVSSFHGVLVLLCIPPTA